MYTFLVMHKQYLSVKHPLTVIISTMENIKIIQLQCN